MKLEAPITTTKVANVLSVSSSSVVYLCSNKHNRTNLWSKAKPIRAATSIRLTEQDKINAYYGISVNLNITGVPVYTYAPPRGGANEPYRLGDFIGYDHTAKTGVTFKVTEATKNIFNDQTPFTLYLEDNPDLITFYDIRHHPNFAAYTTMRFIASNVDNGNYIRRELPISSRPLYIELSNSELSNLGTGTVRIYGEVTNGSISNNKVLAQDCILEITTDVGIMFDLSNLYVGTTNSNLKPVTSYKPGMGGSLNINGSDLAFGTIGVENNSGITISQSNIYIIFRYTDTSGKKVYKRCPVFSNVDSGPNQTRPWSLTSGSGRYYLKPIIADKDIPLINSNGYTVAASVAFQYRTTRNGTDAYFDFTPSTYINLVRSSGTEPTPV